MTNDFSKTIVNSIGLFQNTRIKMCVRFDTGQPTRRGVQKPDQNSHHPSKGGVNSTNEIRFIHLPPSVL